MDEKTLLLICAILCALTLVVVVAVAIALLRRTSRATQSKGDATNSVGLAPINSTGDIVPVTDSVISRLSFAESIDAEIFAVAVHETSISDLNRRLAASAADGITFSVNGVRLLGSGTEMTFALSRHGQTLLAQGVAVLGRHGTTGQVLPVLRDASTGKIVEMMKGAGTTLTTLGAATAVVVTAAHMIAGADIARRMKQVESKLDLLLQYRRIDQFAKLERIYTSAKELCSGPMSREKGWELWRLRGELRELRCTWRQELHNHLSQITDPKNDSWFESMFSSQQTLDGKVQKKVTEGQIQIGLMEYSLRLDHVFAAIGGTINEFERTLADELSELENLTKLLRSKVEFIKGTSPNLELDPTVKRMAGIIDAFNGLLPATDGPAESATEFL